MKKGNRTRADLALTEKAVWDRRIRGESVVQIAAALDLSTRTVYAAINRRVESMDVTKQLETEAAIDLDLLRGLLKKWYPLAIAEGGAEDGGDPSEKATEIVLKILDRKAKLLGTDAPKRIDIQHLIAVWAEKNGLEPLDVIDAVARPGSSLFEFDNR